MCVSDNVTVTVFPLKKEHKVCVCVFTVQIITIYTFFILTVCVLSLWPVVAVKSQH